MENEKQQAATAANAASRGLPCFDDEEKMSCAIASSETTRHDLRLEGGEDAPAVSQGQSIFAAFVSEAKGCVRVRSLQEF